MEHVDLGAVAAGDGHREWKRRFRRLREIREINNIFDQNARASLHGRHEPPLMRQDAAGAAPPAVTRITMESDGCHLVVLSRWARMVGVDSTAWCWEASRNPSRSTRTVRWKSLAVSLEELRD